METRLNDNSLDWLVFRLPNWSDRLAYRVSEVLCPPIVAGLGFFLLIYSAHDLRVWVWALGVMALVIGVPVGYVLWKVRQGEISDFHIPVRAQRIRPMLITIGCAGLTWAILSIFAAPARLVSLMASSALLTLLLLLITLRWKISAHSLAIASLTVLLIRLFGLAFLPAGLLIPLVIWARIRMRRHTLAQTIGGAVLGLIYTILFL